MLSDIEKQDGASNNQEISKKEIDTNHRPEDCELCQKHAEHKKRYTAARKLYENDVNKIWHDNVDLFAVDMQKILIIPKMAIKNSFLVSRLFCFNETFANLRNTGSHYCMLWHEAIKGRTGSDVRVVSTFFNLLKQLDDTKKHIVFRADNCAAQNKNWTLFSSCVLFVNEDWGPETITFRFF